MCMEILPYKLNIYNKTFKNTGIICSKNHFLNSMEIFPATSTSRMYRYCCGSLDLKVLVIILINCLSCNANQKIAVILPEYL